MSYNFRYISIKRWKYNNIQWRLGSNNNGTAAHLGCPGDLPDATSDAGRSPWPPQLHRRSEKTCISFISDCGDKCNNWHHFSLSMPCVLSSVSRCCPISKTTITKTMSTNADGDLHDMERLHGICGDCYIIFICVWHGYIYVCPIPHIRKPLSLVVWIRRWIMRRIISKIY